MRRLYGATILGAVCWFGLLTYLGAFLVEALGWGPVTWGWSIWRRHWVCLGSLAVGGPLAHVPTRLLVVIGYLAAAVLTALAFSGRIATRVRRRDHRVALMMGGKALP